MVEVEGVLVGTDVAVAAGAEELTDLQYACCAAPHPNESALLNNRHPLANLRCISTMVELGL
jgi:hypothetical protein